MEKRSLTLTMENTENYNRGRANGLDLQTFQTIKIFFVNTGCAPLSDFINRL